VLARAMILARELAGKLQHQGIRAGRNSSLA